MAKFKVSLLVGYNHIVLSVFYGSHLVFSPVAEVNVLSKKTHSESTEPKMTSDGKFQCEADNRTFNTREEYDRHCSESHVRSDTKGW